MRPNGTSKARRVAHQDALCANGAEVVVGEGFSLWLCLFLIMMTMALGLSPTGANASSSPASNPNSQSQALPVPDVALAGLAFAGTEATILSRFPHSRRYAETKATTGSPVYQRLMASVSSQPSPALQIVQSIDDLKGRDQALSVALVIGSETVAVDQLGSMYKLMVLIRGQAMFFDFKSMNVVRAYPLSFAYVDLFDRKPSDAEIASRVQMVFEGAGGKPGLLDRFGRAVSRASIPQVVPKFIQVTSSKVSPEATDLLPDYLRSQASATETWLADIVAEAISTRMGVPMVPFSKGYAVGNVMSMTVSDGKVWELKLPKPDYEVAVELTGLKKIKFSEVTGGATSFVYGAYANLRITDALGGGMNTSLKNGETRVIPASQKHVDDFPHYYDAINGLFAKSALAIAGQTGGSSAVSNQPASNISGAEWIKTAASAKDIGQQVEKIRSMLMQSK